MLITFLCDYSKRLIMQIYTPKRAKSTSNKMICILVKEVFEYLIIRIYNLFQLTTLITLILLPEIIIIQMSEIYFK